MWTSENSTKLTKKAIHGPFNNQQQEISWA